ncbi:hypothetical protein [Catellatospora sichuanensis]|uniref:hypothetical protein n=1 Tax=Catellatospora sichuanensis TaxID=1969805 RepID=UPI00118357BC|nr:hypothetical protein [Catellatospora sichuanensis]
MDWSSVGPAVFSLIGVVVGSVGSFLAQSFVAKVSREQAEANRRAAHRAERREAVHAFIGAAQAVESLAQRLHVGQVRDDTEAYGLLQQMWLAQRLLELVCGEAVRNSALAFTIRIRAAVWDLPPSGKSHVLWEFLTPERSAFMAAARSELALS